MHRRQVLLGIGTVPLAIAAKHEPRKSAQAAPAISLTDFGPIGDESRGDNDTVEAALAQFAGKGSEKRQGTLLLPRAAVFLTRPIIVSSGVQLVGEGGNFGSQLVPTRQFNGREVIRIGNQSATEPWIFRVSLHGFSINCNLCANELPALITVYKAYAITMRDLLLHNVKHDGVRISKSNHTVMDCLQVYGDPKSSRSCGICVSDSLNACIDNPDLEALVSGVRAEGRTVMSVSGAYLERCATAFTIHDGAIACIFGGLVRISTPASVAINVASTASRIRTLGLTVESHATEAIVRLAYKDVNEQARLREDIIWLPS